ncbi:MAG: RNA 2',3'-cyclic phosphodiesterase [Opitutaceae bacterium]|nr:RNA 2',3'-cyclic phosphodiesterase [Opitutaceae bacterium]
MSSRRLFVAIDLPEVVRCELAALAAPVPGLAWTRPEQLHLTLRFLGDTAEELIPAIATTLATVAVEPFVLPVSGMGVFPLRGLPRVLWVGLGRAHTRLFQLRQQVDDALLRVDMNIEMRSFQPHITLGRIRTKPPLDKPARNKLDDFLRRNNTFEAPPFRVSDFHLYSSDLRSTGAVHTVLHTFPLHA